MNILWCFTLETKYRFYDIPMYRLKKKLMPFTLNKTTGNSTGKLSTLTQFPVNLSWRTWRQLDNGSGMKTVRA